MCVGGGIMKDFFDNVCKIDSNALIDCNTLYAAYILWCINHNEEPRIRKELGSCIKEQGGIKKNGRYGQAYWEGVAISEEYKRKLEQLGHYSEVQI